MSCPHSNCPLNNPSGCNYSDPSECDLAKILSDTREISRSAETWAPLYVRFTYKDVWRHIGPEETYAVWTVDDFGFAVHAFRELHDSEGENPGALIAFRTRDLIDWEVWGEVPEYKLRG